MFSQSEEFPEFAEATKAMEAAGEKIQLAALPLQKIVAECTARCFSGIRDAWEVKKTQAEEISRCVSRCEEPVSRLDALLETERNGVVREAVDCMQRCGEGEDDCYKNCVKTNLSSRKIDEMVSRVVSQIRFLGTSL